MASKSTKGTVKLNGPVDNLSLSVPIEQLGGAGDQITLNLTSLYPSAGTLLANTGVSQAGALLTMAADGTVSYKAGGLAETLLALAEGEMLGDQFDFTVRLGGDASGALFGGKVTLDFRGENDTPTISPLDPVQIKDGPGDDTPAVINGILQGVDPDHGARLTYTLQSSSGNAGSLSLAPDGHYSFTPDATLIDTLKGKQSADAVFEVAVTDEHNASSVASLRFTLVGANDTATISGDISADVLPNGLGGTIYKPVGGTLAVQDLDAGEAHFALTGMPDPKGSAYFQDGRYGSFGFVPATGEWGYALDSSRPEFIALAAGDDRTEVFAVYSLDGSAKQDITISVHGRNEPATIAGAGKAFAVDEDGVLSAGDVVRVIDPDHDQNMFRPAENLQGSYGDFTFNALKGIWGYTLRNGDANVQALGAGQVVQDSLHLVSLDGTAEADLVIDITGRADMSVADDAASVAVDDLLANIDVRANDTGVTSVMPKGPSTLGATISVNPDGTLDYDASGLDGAMLAALKQDQRLADDFYYIAVGNDGSRQEGHVLVDIVGKNDGPSIRWQDAPDLFDTASHDGTTTRSGSLVISDPDSSDFSVVVSGAPNNVGSLSVEPSGAYIYTLPDGVLDAMQADATARDRFVVQVIDDHGAIGRIPMQFTRIGVDDSPTLSAGTNGTPRVVEDGIDGRTAASGFTVVSDPDNPDPVATFTAGQLFAAEDPQGALGSFVLGTAGEWKFILNNDAYAVQALKASDFIPLHFDIHTADNLASYTQEVQVAGSDDAASFGAMGANTIFMGATNKATGRFTITDPDLGEAGMVKGTGTNDAKFLFGNFLATTTNAGSTNTVSWEYTVRNDTALASAVDASPDSIVHDRQTLYSTDGSANATLDIAINGAKTYRSTESVIAHFDANDMVRKVFPGTFGSDFLGSAPTVFTDASGNEFASTLLSFHTFTGFGINTEHKYPTVVLVGYTAWHNEQLV